MKRIMLFVFASTIAHAQPVPGTITSYTLDDNYRFTSIEGVSDDGRTRFSERYRYYDDHGIPTTLPFSYQYTTTVGSYCTDPALVAMQVEAFYSTILRRASDDEGKAFWTSAVVSRCAAGVSPAQAFGQVAYGFFFSTEYLSFQRDAAGYITDLYAALLGRAPDAGGFSWWQQVVAWGYSREFLLQGFTNSDEMTARFSPSTYASPWLPMAVQ